MFTRQFYIVKSVISLSIVTACDDCAGPLLGGGGEEGCEEPGEGDHGQLAAAHRAVAVRGVPPPHHRPHRGHHLQGDRQEGDVGEDVSVGDEDVADGLGEDESSDALLVDGEDLHHDSVQNVAP